MRLEDPHGTIFPIHGHCTLTLVSKLVVLFKSPGFCSVVILPNPVIKFSGESSDDGLISGIGKTQSTRGESAQMRIGREHQNRLS